MNLASWIPKSYLSWVVVFLTTKLPFLVTSMRSNHSLENARGGLQIASLCFP